jgi:hypothetical protein
MYTGNGKAASLSKEIRDIISKDPYVKNSLAEGLINYSALARRISPIVEKNLNRKVKEESLIVAIKRHADEIEGKVEKNDYQQILAKTSLSLQEDVACIILNSNDSVMKLLEPLLKDTNWRTSENRILIQSPGRITLVVKSEKAEELLKKVPGEVIDVMRDCSLLTLREPIDVKGTYGIIAEVTALLSKKGISIELFSSPQDLYFLVSGKDSEEAYKTFKELIKTARENNG